MFQGSQWCRGQGYDERKYFPELLAQSHKKSEWQKVDLHNKVDGETFDMGFRRMHFKTKVSARILIGTELFLFSFSTAFVNFPFKSLSTSTRSFLIMKFSVHYKPTQIFCSRNFMNILWMLLSSFLLTQFPHRKWFSI